MNSVGACTGLCPKDRGLTDHSFCEQRKFLSRMFSIRKTGRTTWIFQRIEKKRTKTKMNDVKLFKRS